MGIVTFPSHQPKWEAPVQNWSSSRSFSTLSATSTRYTKGGLIDSAEIPKDAKENEVVLEVEGDSSSYQPPRFSVFGKKAKIDAINRRASLIEQKAEDAAMKDTDKDSHNAHSTGLSKKKFELHPSTLSTANNRYSTGIQEEEQQQQYKEPAPLRKRIEGRTKKRVKFSPIFLERVCLFHESQSPCELKEAHDNKRLQQPCFRLLCPRWPSFTASTQLQKNIILDKKLFYVTPNNTAITGKLMIRNVALDKSVMIRYTLDHWHTSNHEVDAQFFGPYLKNVNYDMYEVSLDLFPFGYHPDHDNGAGDHRNNNEITEDRMFIKDHGEVRGKVEFSVRLTAGNTDFWDDNDGQYYQIKVICDPLNNPWKNYHKNYEGDTTLIKSVEQKEANERLQHLQQQAAFQAGPADPEREEEDTETDTESIEDEVEAELIEEGQQKKHSQFETALKGYKRAKPLHLKKPQPWLGTRYDFAHSLSEAKKKKLPATSESNDNLSRLDGSPEVTNPPLFNQGYFTLTHTSSREAEKSEPALVSPPSSPTVEAMNASSGGRKRFTRTFTTLKRIAPNNQSDNDIDTKTHIPNSRCINSTARYHSPPPTYYSHQLDHTTLSDAEAQHNDVAASRSGSSSPLFSREVYYLSSTDRTRSNDEPSPTPPHNTAALPLSPKPSPKLQNTNIQALHPQAKHTDLDEKIEERQLGRYNKSALLDINSSHYLDLLDKYCFFTPENSDCNSSSSSVDGFSHTANNALQIVMNNEQPESP